MAVGLAEPAGLLPVGGVRIGVAALGGRRTPRDDLVLFSLAPGTTGAAVFTRNAFRAAPVSVAREHLDGRSPRGLLVNAGNANAGTGERGLADARACCALAAGALGCEATEVLPFSTGVIGEPLPVERFERAIPGAAAALSPDGWEAAARAIMTTDTVPKAYSTRAELPGGSCAVTGMAKGAGMIRPDMATMLCFVATDAVVEPAVLDAALHAAVERSFNRITVDGDTSTNDACVVVATGASGVRVGEAEAAPGGAFAEALDAVCETLAQALVRDAEGATRFVTVEVTGGAERSECREVAYALAHSPLVMTAIYAGDANWGRILAAVGRSGPPRLDVARVSVRINGTRVAEGGARAASYTEAAGQAAMSAEEIHLVVDLGRGGEAFTVWTSDLSHDYVTINAEYRT